MFINKANIRNFRLLSDSEFDFKKGLNLIVGRNNTGKTSFMVLFEKFLKQDGFDFNDFSINLREKLISIDQTTDETELSIQLIINVKYEEDDNLCNLSEFIIDLDPERMDVNILFECAINKNKLLEGLSLSSNMSKEKFITKYISEYLDIKVYTFDTDADLEKENRHRLIQKEFKQVRKLIDFEIIHAKRSVSSSEEKRGKKVLSGLTTSFFNSLNPQQKDKFEAVNVLINEMDDSLNQEYELFFSEFLQNAKEFLSIQELKVVSNLKAKEILSDASEVVYGDENKQLPEYLNGLGHMNILYLLLDIEIKKSSLQSKGCDIKLLFIEEPEAHTHPQLQYIFARKIDELLKDIPGFQSVISTHSPHIVSKHPFENIRYMLQSDDNVKIVNFVDELEKLYTTEKESFTFLKQYLSIESSELFFADKVIFIEGISESLLINNFIAQYDTMKINEEKSRVVEELNKDFKQYVPLATQNISILQVGANAKAFRYFLELLNIPTLIITDIDTTAAIQTKKGVKYKASAVENAGSSNTSNNSIKYFLNAPELKDSKFNDWYNSMIEHNIALTSSGFIYIAYQNKENGYYARSFEDAFINVNLEILKQQKDNLWGVKNIDEFDINDDLYDLTEQVIDKKSDFASSLLYLAHTKNINWEIPSYIREGIEWLQKQ